MLAPARALHAHHPRLPDKAPFAIRPSSTRAGLRPLRPAVAAELPADNGPPPADQIAAAGGAGGICHPAHGGLAAALPLPHCCTHPSTPSPTPTACRALQVSPARVRARHGVAAALWMAELLVRAGSRGRAAAPSASTMMGGHAMLGCLRRVLAARSSGRADMRQARACGRATTLPCFSLRLAGWSSS